MEKVGRACDAPALPCRHRHPHRPRRAGHRPQRRCSRLPQARSLPHARLRPRWPRWAHWPQRRPRLRPLPAPGPAYNVQNDGSCPVHPRVSPESALRCASRCTARLAYSVAAWPQWLRPRSPRGAEVPPRRRSRRSPPRRSRPPRRSPLAWWRHPPSVLPPSAPPPALPPRAPAFSPSAPPPALRPSFWPPSAPPPALPPSAHPPALPPRAPPSPLLSLPQCGQTNPQSASSYHRSSWTISGNYR